MVRRTTTALRRLPAVRTFPVAIIIGNLYGEMIGASTLNGIYLGDDRLLG